MWELLNKIENKLLKQYTTIDLEEEIKRIYNSYSLDTKIASKSNVERFKGFVQKKQKLSYYIAYPLYFYIFNFKLNL